MAEIIKMNENTWRIEDGFVRFFVLAGSEKAALIDSGINTPDARKMAEELTGLPVILINTHGDGDHTSGTSAFDEIMMTKADYIECGVKDRFPGTALKELFDGDEIDLGDRILKIILVPGHTVGSIAILDEVSRILFAGDSVQKGHIYMFGDKRRPDEFAASLEKLISMKGEYDSIAASHDEALLPGDYAGKVLEDWLLVRAGQVSCEETELFGNRIKSYTAKACGFFLQ